MRYNLIYENWQNKENRWIRTQDLMHAARLFYHCTTSVDTGMTFGWYHYQDWCEAGEAHHLPAGVGRQVRAPPPHPRRPWRRRHGPSGSLGLPGPGLGSLSPGPGLNLNVTVARRQFWSGPPDWQWRRTAAGHGWEPLASCDWTLRSRLACRRGSLRVHWNWNCNCCHQ